MTNQEMRNIKESLGVEMFKLNYKAGIRLPNLEAFFAGDDNALNGLDAKARDRLEKVLADEVKKSKKK
ncbi:MAG: hypothetical protein E7230_02340 [Clostridiales bacterium]|nr:hypothetical protein [Clostridiales bacterium]MBR0469390.1 hypothetical protein [Mogibacterium sp.]